MCVLNKTIHTAKNLLQFLLKLQNKKIENYFLKHESTQIEEKLLILASDIYGLIEQIEVLNIIKDKSLVEKLDFINNFTDLDLNDEDITSLCEDQNLNFFSVKYDASNLLQNYPSAYNHFLKQTEYFIHVLNLFRMKRLQQHNVYELLKLKSLAIKHLCVLEFLVGLHK
ncbi:pkip [Oxyplax ochracea nucleopolyhedrovirus]|uniref:Pkip n=1 Tax=Oxyplax ochracea nucleopolyhedrovirus TaxID=2083176 RepID=A0A2L0WU73_9ABAC|nr:pkip [Oxyplax ochracea nucleopolyhedrovirus]AVA31203.1 pkip [Oxyplax ochracea nucleopolyhedrovirus]